jgi:hypothetical protein
MIMEQLSPIAPSQQIKSDPVATVNVEQPAMQGDPAQSFDNAVSERNPVAMLGIAQKNYGTPAAQAALHAADVMYRTSKEFDALAEPIIQKGGLQTSEGRLEVARKFETVKDNPRTMDALFLALMGDKQGARRMIMGGQVSRKITYDNAGRQLEEYTNELGETEKVRELGTGRELSPAEYEARGGGRSKLEETLGYLTKKANLETNREAYKQTERQSNAYASAAPEIQQLNAQRIDLLKGLKDLPDDVRTKAFEFANESYAKGQEVSKSIDTLKQLTASNGLTVGQKLDKRLSASLGAGIWEYKGSGSFVNDRGESRNIQDLDSKSEADRVASDIKNSFTRTRDDLITFERYKRMDEDQKKRLDLFLENSRRLAEKNAELSANFGNPTFLVTPSAFAVSDQLQRGEIQSVQGIFNAQAASLFDQYRREMIANYPADQLPNPKELEANFVKTPEYRALREKFKKQTDEIIDRPQELAPTQTKEARKPPETATSTAPARSAPPKEETRLTPEQILNNRKIKKPSER